MFAVCLRYTKNHTEAEDTLQEGFVRVFTKLDQFQHKGSFEGWIRRVMVHTALEKQRKMNLTMGVEDITTYEKPTNDDQIISSISADDLRHNATHGLDTLFKKLAR